jgi:hypothetical protein
VEELSSALTNPFEAILPEQPSTTFGLSTTLMMFPQVLVAFFDQGIHQSPEFFDAARCQHSRRQRLAQVVFQLAPQDPLFSVAPARHLYALMLQGSNGRPTSAGK